MNEAVVSLTTFDVLFAACDFGWLLNPVIKCFDRGKYLTFVFEVFLMLLLFKVQSEGWCLLD